MIFFYVLIVFAAYFVGHASGRVQGKLKLMLDIQIAQQEVAQTLKLAKMKGVDVSQLSEMDIAKMVLKRREELKEE